MEERVLRNFAKTLEGGSLRGGVLSTFEDNFERSNHALLKSQTQINSRWHLVERDSPIGLIFFYDWEIKFVNFDAQQLIFWPYYG